MPYIYKEYEEQIFRMSCSSNIIKHSVEIYRKGRGFVPFGNAALIVMHGYDISERQAKDAIAKLILKR